MAPCAGDGSVGVFGVSGSYMLNRGRGVISGGSADGPKDEIWRQNTVVNFEQGRAHCLGVDNSNGNDPFILDFSNLGALKKVCVDHGYDSNCDAWASEPTFRAEGVMFSLLGYADPATLRRWFEALGDGGEVVDALQVRPWGASDGQVIDRYGVQWLIGFEGAEEA